MVQRVLTVLCIGFMCIFVAGCGQSYELQSISVSPTSPNLEGIGSTQQLAVTAHYSNTKSNDVTIRSNYELGASLNPLAPLDAVTLSTSGLLQDIVSPTTGLGSCTWTATGIPPVYTTDPYPVTITYTEHGVTATTYSYVSVDSGVALCYDGQLYPEP